ncbi:MAG TPA: carboxypeptidase regulatory-like domain-containing protein [Acidobacteriaceae bacterium]|nr:carboxypeptidase regulatory-like domain-containing protein [Acidobacteriaceae bacterium]
MSIRVRVIVAALLCGCCGLLPRSASAQGFGTISGSVADPSGAAVPSANVTVTEVSTGLSRTAVTNQDGYYVLNSIKPSGYVLSVDQAGFKKFTQTGIVLLANQSLTVNIALSLGSTSESVSVNAAATQVDLTTPTLRQVVDSSRMVEMPLNGRNAAQLTTLVAGAVTAPSNNADQGPTKTFPEAVTISTNGARENQISYLLDGVPNVDFISNVNQPFPFPDALQEFSVQTSNYSAEYGQNAGGVVSIVTKSGTNSFHGDAFGFLRNGAFNARNFFASKVDPLKRSQFGGTLGGPIIKDRTFFFVGYQGTRIRSNQGGLNSFVPTDANLAGDFSSLLQANNPNNPLGKAVLIKDPLTGQPFPGNIIPTSRFDPASVAMMKYLPRAQGNGIVFYGKAISQNLDEYIARLDHSFSAKDRFVGRYYWDRYVGAPAYGGNLLAYTDGSTITSQNAALQEMHIFGPNLLNDFRFGLARIVSNRQPPSGTPTVKTFGLNIYQPPISTIQTISVAGYFGTGGLPTAQFPRTGFSWTDDLRWVHGRHSFAFGGLIERDRLDMVNYLGEPGTFTFSGDTTGSSLADFMLGQLRTFGQAMGQHVKNRYLITDGYAQDSFRLSGRLTLSYGVRYDPSQVWHDLYHQNQVFYPGDYASGVRSTVFPNAPAGLMFSGDKGVPEWGTTGDYRNVAPRVGFAYDVFGNGDTSVRGGFGIFYDSRVDAFSNNRELGAAPYSATVSLTTPKGPFSNPYLGITNPFPAPFPPPSDSKFVLPVQVFSWDPHHKLITPRNYSVNLAIEQNLKHGFLARFAYVGSRATNMTTTIDQNPAVYMPGSKLTTDQRRSYQNFTNIFQISQSGNSWYHSAQFSLLKPLSHGFTVSANYTWSKSTDTLPYNTDAATFGTSGYYTLPLNFPDFRRYDRGRSDFDHRHVFVTSYVWQAPALEGRNAFLRFAAGGWEISGVVTAESGGPLTLYAGKDQSQTGIGSDRAQLVGQQIYSSGFCGTSSPCVHYLNSSAFTLPAIGSFGNVGKGQFTGPGYFDWDMGLFKNLAVTERWSVQLRGEFFNTFNRANFLNPVTTESAGGFGNILSANDPRIVQLALKVIF